MRFNERKEFLYDSDIFRRSDVKTALSIQAEFVLRHSPRPHPRFFEIDRSESNFDDLWHISNSTRTLVSRELDIPAIISFEKPDWRLTRVGIQPQRRDKFWLANTHLNEFDYFPEQGDMVFYNGYRYLITRVSLEPGSYWLQTNVWLGLVCEAVVAIDGDVRPIPDHSKAAPAELNQQNNIL